ncbi:hypothetical protein MUP77_05760, partial [Candidatus Bathyarchaeota archaeon]|nr:hypothetical protein [Candidatus Bathyarchaeota archaeon]
MPETSSLEKQGKGKPMKKLFVCFFVVLCGCIAVRANATQREDILIADFEGETYGEWKVTGEAFGPGPAQGTLPNQMQVSGFE